jgi:polyhydroxyalkanoate synthesis regulator phasin
VPEEKKRDVVGELARRGEVRARDLQKLARTLADRVERNRTELSRLVQKEIRRQINALGLATREEVDTLRKRIRQLESKTPRKKTSPAKKKS